MKFEKLVFKYTLNNKYWQSLRQVWLYTLFEKWRKKKNMCYARKVGLSTILYLYIHLIHWMSSKISVCRLFNKFGCQKSEFDIFPVDYKWLGLIHLACWRQNFEMFFYYFSQIIAFVISCRLSLKEAKETICMKYQSLFLKKKIRKISPICWLLNLSIDR